MKVSTINHLVELRQCLLKAVACFTVVFLILFYFRNTLYTWVATPLLNQLPEGGHLIATEVTTTFVTPLKLCLNVSMGLSFPFFFYQIWQFVSPGLYRHEKQSVLPLVVTSSFLFYLGLGFAYFVLCPIALAFFVASAPLGVEMMTDIASYLNFMLNIHLATGLAFQVPIITLVLLRFGWVTHEQLSHYRSYIIVLAFILGMLLTPPDVISQIILALPIWGLFELGLFIGKKQTFSPSNTIQEP